MSYIPRADCQIPTLVDIYEKHLSASPGRFVEVGAYDGISYSNTVFLAEAGWTGIYVEPHPDFAAECIRNHSGHPGIRVVQTAIGDVQGTADLFVIGACSTMVWDKSAVDWGGSKDRKISVPVMTMDALLTDLAWQPDFDLLVIDVEQNEIQVLAGFDATKWKPRLVIIEAHELDAEPARNWKALPITSYFESRGYTKIYADQINTIFKLTI